MESYLKREIRPEANEIGIATVRSRMFPTQGQYSGLDSTLSRCSEYLMHLCIEVAIMANANVIPYLLVFSLSLVHEFPFLPLCSLQSLSASTLNLFSRMNGVSL